MTWQRANRGWDPTSLACVVGADRGRATPCGWKRPLDGLWCFRTVPGELVGGLFYFNNPRGTGLMAGSVFGRTTTSMPRLLRASMAALESGFTARARRERAAY
jgi:hypothetical protein